MARGASKQPAGIGGDHGEQVHHPLISGNLVISEPWAFDLRTGSRLNPNGTGVAFPQIGLWDHLGFVKLSLLSRQLPYGLRPQALRKLINRPGCWISIIPAGGLVLLPEGSSGCVCSYPLQTSMALLPQ